MKKVYIIHGWGQDSNMPWIKWLEEELSKKNVEVHAFDMPNTNNPTIEEWVNYLKENISGLDENTHFIAHSIGAQTVLRMLEKEHKHIKVGSVVFVAPWIELVGLNSEELRIAHPWLNSKIDFERVFDHIENATCIFSTDDPYVSEKEQNKFKEGLNAKIIMKKNFGHFEETDKIEEILHELK